MSLGVGETAPEETSRHRTGMPFGRASAVPNMCHTGGVSSREERRVENKKIDTAVVFIDPQNDVLSEDGVNWTWWERG